MEYSLYTLNKSSELDHLTLTDLIDKLNLIGFEVDDIFLEELENNSNLNNIRLLIKIPSNREDLLNEIFLQKELATIFFFNLKESWKNLKSNYLFLLNQKYQYYSNYKTTLISSNLPNLLMYNIELEQCENYKTPIWLKKKLLNAGLKVASTFDDLITLVNFEWGQTLNLFLADQTEEQFSLEQLKEATLYSKNEIILEKGTIVLKNSINEILSVLGLFSSFLVKSEKKKIILQGIFYDIHENSLNLNTINTKVSLRFLRKTYLETFKFSFQRLLTLIEILTLSKIKLKKYITKQNFCIIQSEKILYLDKNILKKFLNIDKINFQIFEKSNLKLLCNTKDKLYFQIPNFRKDLNRDIDLIEEYSRFMGYKNFKEIFPKKSLTYYFHNKTNFTFIKQFFLNSGFNEIITSSLEGFNEDKKSSIKINNPLNTDLGSLRSNLLGKIIETFENNFKLNGKGNNYFEIGRVFKISNQKIIEQDKIGGIFQLPNLEKGINNSINWFRAKGFIESLLFNFGYSNLDFLILKEYSSYYHPVKSVYILKDKHILGKFGELNPLKTSNFSTKHSVYIFELNLIYFKKVTMTSKIPSYNEYSKYPLISKDISFQISRKKDFSKIKTIIKENCQNLKTIEFFDIYFDEENNNSINIGLHLEFQSKFQTLLKETIDNEIKKIKQLLIENFDAFFKD
jgi:phenylalanyl-tRNA synthetase beta chain